MRIYGISQGSFCLAVMETSAFTHLALVHAIARTIVRSQTLLPGGDKGPWSILQPLILSPLRATTYCVLVSRPGSISRANGSNASTTTPT
ncbi:hypothetical protein Micbo1qcDRAFT_166075, partial [Microdochium bolleyi]